MASTPENRVKAACKKLLKEHDIWYFCPIGGMYSTHGVPDIVCVAPNDHVFFVETKAPGKLNTLTANQKACHEEIRSRGGTVLVVDNVKPLEEFIRELEQTYSGHEKSR
jgi:hypothetical protein